MKRKPKSGNRLHLLDGEQRQALGKFQTDFQTALPHMQSMAAAAQRLHKDMIDAPVWRIVDTPKPEEVETPQLWTVGHAKVNYVDHIEGMQDK